MHRRKKIKLKYLCVCNSVCNSVTSLHFGNYLSAVDGNVPCNVRYLNIFECRDLCK